jgi:hypothetical protein
MGIEETLVDNPSVEGERTRRAYRVRGVSVPGYEHISAALPGQDAWRALTAPRGSILVVADGAGSAPRSAEGAAIAAGAAIAEADRHLRTGTPDQHDGWAALLRDIVTSTALLLRETASTLGGEVSEFATTLTICLLVDDWCACLRVGDGFVAGRLGWPHDPFMGYHLILPLPDTPSGDQSLATKFLTSPDLPDLLRDATNGFDAHAAIAIVRDPQLTGVLIGSDGIKEATVERRSGIQLAFAGFLGPVFAAVDENVAEGLVRLLIDDLAATSGDDKTAVVAIREQVGQAQR